VALGGLSKAWLKSSISVRRIGMPAEASVTPTTLTPDCAMRDLMRCVTSCSGVALQRLLA
jgi:hypothetical protein